MTYKSVCYRNKSIRKVNTLTSKLVRSIPFEVGFFHSVQLDFDIQPLNSNE